MSGSDETPVSVWVHPTSAAGVVTDVRIDVIEAVENRDLDTWRAWPVYWSAVWVGALAVIALAIVFGLASVAVGAHELGTGSQIPKWSDVSRQAVAFAVFGAFLSGCAGWVGGR